jgi:hypothetical protein
MSRIVYMTSEDPLSDESIEQLKRIAAMPDSEIRTDLIPEKRFNLALAAERRRSGWTPGKASAAFKASLKKAS